MKKDIYLIKNDINKKVYIGQSVDAKNRFAQHKSEARLNTNKMLIHKAIRKYGEEHFSLIILESQIENYDERERYWIQYYILWKSFLYFYLIHILNYKLTALLNQLNIVY